METRDLPQVCMCGNEMMAELSGGLTLQLRGLDQGGPYLARYWWCRRTDHGVAHTFFFSEFVDDDWRPWLRYRTTMNGRRVPFIDTQ